MCLHQGICYCLKYLKMSKRLAKTSYRQYEELLKHIKKYKVLLKSKIKPTESRQIDFLWKQFAIYINSLGYGPPKTGKQWRHIFNEWKTNTKRKNHKIKLEMVRSEGRYIGKSLNELEKELLSLISKQLHSEDTDEKGVPDFKSEIEITDHCIEDDDTEEFANGVDADDYVGTLLVEEPNSSSYESNQEELTHSLINIATALNSYTATYREIERAKLKLQYFNKFGTFENFESLFS